MMQTIYKGVTLLDTCTSYRITHSYEYSPPSLFHMKIQVTL